MEQSSDHEDLYRVLVSDNWHYMEAEDRYEAGVFDSCEAAVIACRDLVDGYLASAYRPGISADDLLRSYQTFGVDPFIVSRDEGCRFSAWDYARLRTAELCGPHSDPR